MPPRSRSTSAKKAKTPRKAVTNTPKAVVTRIVQLFTTEHRTKAKPEERFKMTATGDGKVKIERESRYSYGGGAGLSDWDECDETYVFLISDLEAAIKLVKDGE